MNKDRPAATFACPLCRRRLATIYRQLDHLQGWRLGEACCECWIEATYTRRRQAVEHQMVYLARHRRAISIGDGEAIRVFGRLQEAV